MPSEIEEAVERARRQSEAFMERSRAQMLQTYQEQRSVMMGQAPQQVAGGGMMGPPQPGTPAGRLMDTITSLIRQGAAFGQATISPIGQVAGFAGGGMGAAAGFAMAPTPFGVRGVGGGGMGEARALGFWQTMFTAYGAGLPFGLGAFAGQRLDMTQRQAQMLAREELGYRLSAGAREAAYGFVDTATLGIYGMIQRRRGLEFEQRDLEYFTRTAQEQLRFVSRRAIAAAGLGEEAYGPFITGVSRRGAREYGRAIARGMGGLQAEMGITREEAANLLGMGARTMGTAAIQRAFVRGPGEYRIEMERQARAVRDIRQILNLTEEQAREFFETVGESLGSAADNIVVMARRAQQAAGRMGMSRRVLMQMTQEFAGIGAQQGFGAGGFAEAMMGQVGLLREWQLRGMISPEEMRRYGGTTSEEMLRRQAMVRYQQNLAMWQRPGMMQGIGMMATQAPGLFQRFMGGAMGPMQAMGAIGGMMIQDPLARMRAMQDPRQYQLMATMADRMAFQMVQGMQRQGMFAMFGGPANQRVMAINQFGRLMGMDPLEARQRYSQYERELLLFRMRSERRYRGRDTRVHAEGMSSIYNKIIAQGAGSVAMEVTGTGSVMEAAESLYNEVSRGGRENVPSDMTMEDLLSSAAGRTGGAATPERQARAFETFLSRFWAGGGGGYRGMLERGDIGEPLRPVEVRGPSGGVYYAQPPPPGGNYYAALRRETFTPERIGALGAELGRLGWTPEAVRQLMFGGQGAMRIETENVRYTTADKSVLWGFGQPWNIEKSVDTVSAWITMKELDGKLQLAIMQGKEVRATTLDEIAARFDRDTADRVAVAMANNAGRMLNAENVKSTIAGFRARGLIVSPQQAAYRRWVRGRAAAELRGIFGEARVEGMAPQAANLDWFARAIAASDEAGKMSEEARLRIQEYIQTTGTVGRWAGWAQEVTVSGPVWTGELEWVRPREGRVRPEYRVAQLQAVLGGDAQRVYRAMANVFNQTEVSFAGVGKKEWTPDEIRRVVTATSEQVQDDFVKHTELSKGFLDALTTALAGQTEKIAKSERGHSEGTPLYEKIVDMSDAVAEKIAKAAKGL